MELYKAHLCKKIMILSIVCDIITTFKFVGLLTMPLLIVVPCFVLFQERNKTKYFPLEI